MEEEQKNTLLIQWDSKMVIASSRGSGHESGWCCAAVPMKSLLMFVFCPVLVQNERYALLWSWLYYYLEQLPSAKPGAWPLGTGSLKCSRPEFAQKSTSAAFPWYSCLSKHSVPEGKKGCSANSLVFRKSVEITWTLKPC